MEKNTLMAVVLSLVVITGFYVVQGVFFPPQAPPSPAAPVSSTVPAPVTPTAILDVPGQTSTPAGSPVDGTPVGGSPANNGLIPVQSADTALDEGPTAEQRVTIETNLTRVVLTSVGGDVVSYRLKEHQDGGDDVEMILAGDAAEAHAFTVAFGNLNAEPVTAFFYINRINDYTVEFYRDFAVANGGETGQFRLTKRYTFKPDEYMFELTVSLDGGYSIPSLNFNGAAYTLGFGPQIGPKFEKLDGRYDYRNYFTYVKDKNGKGKLRTEKVKENVPTIIASRVSWAAIAGKYFTFIAIPDSTQYELAFSTKAEPGLSSGSRFYMSRPALNGSRTTDTYRFYLGPKSQKSLTIYDTGINSFNLRDMELSKAASTSGFLAGVLSPLETLLKWFLSIFYKLVHNYGVAIILVTLLVKGLLFPLTKKGSESTLRMQTIAPKIKELQEKYKSNPQQMNVKMAELYKAEGYNPLSGCLPLLIQMPIFLAMYNLFNSHFDLRGAMFIPGWIPDLSLPESIFSFAPHTIPILGWSDIRLLPFLYVGSQLLSSKITQTPDQQINAQMKMMLYVMPIMFFFILYNVPSGLTLYWIMTNLLSMGQQLVINKHLKQKRAAMAAANPAPVIAPGKLPPKKKKKR